MPRLHGYLRIPQRLLYEAISGANKVYFYSLHNCLKNQSQYVCRDPELREGLNN